MSFTCYCDVGHAVRHKRSAYFNPSRTLIGVGVIIPNPYVFLQLSRIYHQRVVARHKLSSEDTSNPEFDVTKHLSDKFDHPCHRRGATIGKPTSDLMAFAHSTVIILTISYPFRYIACYFCRSVRSLLVLFDYD